MELLKEMEETRDNMDCFYSYVTDSFELACEKCYFFSILEDRNGISLDIEFNANYFHKYGESAFYYLINGVREECDILMFCFLEF
ncbi:hypothetical protein HpNP102_15120 [Helicobacter pylori]|nr:hypothetical protein KVJ89_05310 [Helicobacter pylori]